MPLRRRTTFPLVKLKRRGRLDRYLAAILRFAEYWNAWHRVHYWWIHEFRRSRGCDIRLRGFRMVQEDLARVYKYLSGSRSRLAYLVKTVIERNVEEGREWFDWQYIRTHPAGPKKIIKLITDNLGLDVNYGELIWEFLIAFWFRIPAQLRRELASIRPPPKYRRVASSLVRLSGFDVEWVS